MRLKINLIPKKIKIRLLVFTKINLLCLILFLLLINLVFKMYPKVDFYSLKFRRNNIITISGQLLNQEPVISRYFPKSGYEYSYNYEINGKNYQGKSYDVFQKLDDEVLIEYVKEKPSLSRIKNMKSLPIPISGFIHLLLYPILIMAFLFIKTYNYLRLFKTLRTNFNLYYAKLISKQRINRAKIGKMKPIYKLVFKYVDKHGKINKKISFSPEKSDTFITDDFEVIVNPNNDTESYLLFDFPQFLQEFLFGLLLNLKRKSS